MIRQRLIPQLFDPISTRGDGRRLMLGVLLLGQFMGLLDVFVVNVAMPTIGADLHASGASLQLVIGGYAAAYAMLLITGARLGDLYGRRRMYLLGVIVFTTASLACGFASSSLFLIIFRFVQGAGAAVMVPQIMSVIQMQFTGQARAKALSAFGAVLAVGGAAGLVLGGVLVNANLFGATWRPVFLINVPIGIVLAVLVPRVVPVDEPSATRRLDVGGLAIATSAVFLVVLPLVLGHEAGWPAWTYLCIASGLVLVFIFVLFEHRSADRGGDPLLNLNVLHAPGIPSGLITLSFGQLTYGGFLFIFTLHLQSGLGYSALRAGLTYLPMAATFGLVSIYWRRLPEKMHPILTPIGLAVCTLAYLGVSIGMRGGGNGGVLMWTALAVNGMAMGLVVSPLLTQSLVHVPRSQAADASGLLTTTIQLAQVLGIAVFGSIFFSMNTPPGQPSVPTQAHHSAVALSTTGYWLALVVVLGIFPAFALTRGALRANKVNTMHDAQTRPVAPTALGSSAAAAADIKQQPSKFR